MGGLGGLVVATLTPMREDGSIDWDSLGAHVQDLLSAGAEGLFAAGTTGEGLLLEEDERVAVVEKTVKLVAGRIPVVGLCGGLATAQAGRLAVRLREAGADGVAALTPFYYRVDAAAMAEHFRQIADAAGCPTYLYSIPGLTGVELPVEVLERLKSHPRFGGLKYSSGNLAQFLAYVRTGVPILIGCDRLISEALRGGGAGTVSGTAACMPAPYAALFRRLRKGEDATEAQDLATRLAALLDSLPPIVGYKAVLRRRGVIASPAVRRPLRPLTAEEAVRLEAGLRELGL